jgi:[ribosomal protein S18]-alanine N-acetyltransferase
MFRVRVATPADLPALLALGRAAPAAAHWSDAQYRRLCAKDTAHVTLVIEQDYVCGFIVALEVGPEWEIENIVVGEAARRGGLGRRLVGELLTLACARGAHSIFLEVRESNGPARALYSKTGFAEIARRRSYYRDPEEDALLYEKIVTLGTVKSVEA